MTRDLQALAAAWAAAPNRVWLPGMRAWSSSANRRYLLVTWPAPGRSSTIEDAPGSGARVASYRLLHERCDSAEQESAFAAEVLQADAMPDLTDRVTVNALLADGEVQRHTETLPGRATRVWWVATIDGHTASAESRAEAIARAAILAAGGRVP